MDRITQRIDGIPNLRGNKHTAAASQKGKDGKGRSILKQPAGVTQQIPQLTAPATARKKERKIRIIDPKDPNSSPIPLQKPAAVAQETLAPPQDSAPIATDKEPQPIIDRKDPSERQTEPDSPDEPTYHIQLTETPGQVILPPKSGSKGVAKRIGIQLDSEDDEKEPFIEKPSPDILKTAKFLEIDGANPERATIRIWIPKKIGSLEMKRIIELVIDNLSKISTYLQKEPTDETLETVRSIGQVLDWVWELQKNEKLSADEIEKALKQISDFFLEVKRSLEKIDKSNAAALVELVVQFLEKIKNPLRRISILANCDQAINLVTEVLTVKVYYSLKEEWNIEPSNTKICFNGIASIQKIREQCEVRILFFEEKGLDQFEMYFLPIFFPSKRFSSTSFKQRPNFYLLIKDREIEQGSMGIWEAVLSLKNQLYDPNIADKLHYLKTGPYEDLTFAQIAEWNLQKRFPS